MEYLIATLAGVLSGESAWGKIALGVAGGLILLELIGLIEWLAIKLIRLGARMLPRAFGERYAEENEAVIVSARGPIAKILCAVSASAGAVIMRLSMSKGELNCLELRSQSDCDDYYDEDSVIQAQSYETVKRILMEVIPEESRREIVLHTMFFSKLKGVVDIPISENEFERIVRRIYEEGSR